MEKWRTDIDDHGGRACRNEGDIPKEAALRHLLGMGGHEGEGKEWGKPDLGVTVCLFIYFGEVADRMEFWMPSVGQRCGRSGPSCSFACDGPHY